MGARLFHHPKRATSRRIGCSQNSAIFRHGSADYIVFFGSFEQVTDWVTLKQYGFFGHLGVQKFHTTSVMVDSGNPNQPSIPLAPRLFLGDFLTDDAAVDKAIQRSAASQTNSSMHAAGGFTCGIQAGNGIVGLDVDHLSYCSSQRRPCNDGL